MKVNPDLLPVPKVYAASLGTLLVSIVITVLMKYGGWTFDQASQITPAIFDAVYILGPPLATFLFGYFQTDSDRSRLIQERDRMEKDMREYRRQAVLADKTLRNYLSNVKRSDA